MNEKEASSEKRNLWIVLAILCALAILLASLVSINQMNKGNEVETDSSDQELVDDGDEDEPLDEYISRTRNEINNTDDLNKKAKLYMDMADEIYGRPADIDDQRKEMILDSLYTAEELVHSAETAWTIYRYESLFGDEKKADQYYNLANERGYSPVEGRG